jgi:uncharacterized DUF497 family protein
MPHEILFDWDHGNQDKSLQRHGVSDEEIEEAFADPKAKVSKLGSSFGEVRREFLGRVASSGRLLKIIYTVRVVAGKRYYRPISALDMDRVDRAHYGQK